MTVSWFDGASVTVEVGFASNPSTAIGSTTWTDISAYVHSISCRRGRSSEFDQFTAGTLTVVLANADRRFDPNYSSSPYSPNVLPMRRIRFRATYNAVTYDVWAGFVDDWPQEYDIGNTDATVTVSCTDGFKVLSLLKLPESVYALTVAADAPLAWYRLGEQSGTTALDSSGNNRDAVYVGGATFNTRVGLITGGVDNCIGFDAIDDQVQAPPITSYPYSVEFWFSTTDTTGNPSFFNQGLVPGLTTQYTSVSLIGVSGAVTVSASLASNSLTNTSSTGGLTDGRSHHVIVAFPGSSNVPVICIDGVSDSTGAVVGVVPISDTTYFTIGGADTHGNPAAAVTIDEFAVYSSDVSALAAAHYAAGSSPWAGDTTGTRIGRLLDLIAWPTADRTIATGISTLQFADLNFAPALQALQSVEASEQGQLFMGADGTVVFRDRHWRFENTAAITSQATFGDGPGELPYSNIVTDGGEQFLANHIRASRAGGATVDVSDSTSIGKFYERLDEVTGLQNQSDLEVRDLANWRLATRKNPVQRVTVLEVKPRATPTTLFPQILGRDIGHRLVEKRRPQGVGSALTYTVLIEGIEHHITVDGEWVTRFYLSSTDSQAGVQPLILDDATYGILDTNVLGF